MTRFWFPLLIAAAMPCCLIAYLRNEAREQAEWDSVKPDLDNLTKQIKDCLTQMGIWEDDKLVVGYLPGMGKFYSDRPRWEIEVREWSGPMIGEVAA